ncbi:hypothetical protein P3S68_013712 [Capsicum galapagoense]
MRGCFRVVQMMHEEKQGVRNRRTSILKNSSNCACAKLTKGGERSWKRDFGERASHRNYYEMKMRVHMEIAGLLNRIGPAKQLLGNGRHETSGISSS